MTNEEAIARIREHKIIHKMNEPRAIYISEALDLAIKVLEQQPCEDCISRQAVHEMLENIPINESDKWFNWLQKACLRLAELPSVQPTRPTGKWIEKEDYNLDTYYECSECGADYCIEGDILIHKYCPNCGARMTEVESEKGNICDNDCEHCDWVTCPKMEEAESEEEA